MPQRMPRYYANIYAPYEEYEALDRAAEGLPPGPVDVPIYVIEHQKDDASEGAEAIVEIVVDGPTDAELHRSALATYAQLRERAGLEPVDDPGPIAYFPINALLHLDPKSSRFFGFAQQLFDDGQFLYAIVAVQTAFELYLEGVYEYLLHLRTPREVGTVVQKFLTQKYSLSREEVRELLEALLGERLADSSEWHEYKQHVKRRNGIVHRGEGLGRDEAHSSLTAVQELAGVISKRVRTIMSEASQPESQTS